MRYRLRTLLILLAIGPTVLAVLLQTEISLVEPTRPCCFPYRMARITMFAGAPPDRRSRHHL
jgi:hypothetical protein